jgi:hypothetical protein
MSVQASALRLDEHPLARGAEAVTGVGAEAEGGGIEAAGETYIGARVELGDVDLDEIIDVEPAAEIGGVAADLAPFDIECAAEPVVGEVAEHAAAEKAEQERVAFGPHPPFGRG